MRDVMTGDKVKCCNMLIKNIEAEVTFPLLLPCRALVNGMTACEKKKSLDVASSKKAATKLCHVGRAGGKGKSRKINLCLRTYQFHLNFLAEPQMKHRMRLLLLLLLKKEKHERKKGPHNCGAGAHQSQTMFVS